MKTIIIGGVAGGATIAARLRRIDEKAEIILIERGKYISYANCGLPYYIGDTITDRSNLLIMTKEGFVKRFNIDIRNFNEVVDINKSTNTVTIKNLHTEDIYTESYDKLVISTGAAPIRPELEGIDSCKIFTLRNIPDMDNIKEYINTQKPKTAIVIGGGFIGLEMVENLKDAGLEVSLIERGNQVMSPIDYTMATMIHDELQNRGVNLLLEENVSSFTENTNSITAKLDRGKEITADIIILSIGVIPESVLAKKAELEINPQGAILVNEYMQTSDPNIYALGDAVAVWNPILGKKGTIPLAGPANKQGRIVANNIAEGNKYQYKGTIGTAIAKVFGLTVAVTGVASKVLDRESIEHMISITHGQSHASYYPGALPLSIQIVFAPKTGKLYGAQIVGFDGVDKRIDLIAEVIRNGGSIYDLQEIEHAYAPPYSSAKDPVNMAGFVAENILKEKMKTVYWDQIKDLKNDPQLIIVDTRTSAEYEMGHVEGALNIPVDDLRDRLDEIPKDKKIVVYCAVGLRGYIASRILSQKGYDVANLVGGYKIYSIATKPINNKEFTTTHNNNVPMQSTNNKDRIIIDACGLQCPGPISKLKKHYDELSVGDQMQIKVTDQAFGVDLEGWANMTGARIVSMNSDKGVITADIEKVNKNSSTDTATEFDGKTIVVFNDDLDKALASFVIANGAVAAGKKVSMFFTFWGLNVIKKEIKPKNKKGFIAKIFGIMLPSNSKKLNLSKMNLGGLGSIMIRHIMKSKKIDSLESLIQQAVDNNVEMIACSMSMDVMGVQANELLDNVTVGGVAAYLSRTEKSTMNLFI